MVANSLDLAFRPSPVFSDEPADRRSICSCRSAATCVTQKTNTKSKQSSTNVTFWSSGETMGVGTVTVSGEAGCASRLFVASTPAMPGALALPRQRLPFPAEGNERLTYVRVSRCHPFCSRRDSFLFQEEFKVITALRRREIRVSRQCRCGRDSGATTCRIQRRTRKHARP